jgi:hypothetical protein
MNSDTFDPTPEEQVVVLVELPDVRKSELQIIGCEACSEDAWLTFDSVLDAVTGSDPKVTDYIMEGWAQCPRCLREIHEKSLVEPA